MKPEPPFSSNKRRSPLTDHCFHAGLRDWGANYSSNDGDDRSHLRTFHRLSRDLLLESARERAWEMVVFGFVVLASAWPVIYMVVTVVKLLLRGRPLV
ncbi:MAG: hypothetical protein ACJ8M1_02035 [Chthoniobacterales bacterium]